MTSWNLNPPPPPPRSNSDLAGQLTSKGKFYQPIEQPPLYIMECNPHAAGQLNLQCTALSRDGNFTIQWKWVPLFTHNIVTLQDVIHLSTSNGTNTFVVVSRLKVLSLSDSDCGTYWCEIVAHNANANPLLRSNVLLPADF